MTNPVTCEFRDPATERRYRTAFIARDRGDAVVTVALLLVPLGGYFLADLGFFAASGVPLELLVLRLLVLCCGVATILVCRRPLQPRAFDAVIAAWWILLSVFMLYVNSTRPNGYLLHHALGASMCMVAFVIPPIPLRLQMPSPMILAGGNLAEVWLERDIVGNTPFLVLALTYLTVIVIGFTTAWRLHTLRRRQFATLEQQAAMHARLETLANTDPLTGVSNRRHFLEAASAELARARRHGRALSLMMIDIDFFKRVNDRFGHEAGDAALQGLTSTAHRTLRAQDLVGRLGGEEFAVLLPETDAAEALRAAERLRLRCADIAFSTESPDARFSVSIGVTTLAPADASVHDLLRRADKALYAAKDAGRDRVVEG